MDAGAEQCDDGNAANGDCCSSTCQYEANGSACAADGDPCTDDVCDGAGACGVFNTAPCDDLDACTTIDACDGAGTCAGGGPPPNCNDTNPCSQDSCNSGSGCVNAFAPVGGCKAAGKSILLLKNNTGDDSKDKLIWKWLKGASASQGDWGNVVTMCFYGGPSDTYLGNATMSDAVGVWSPIPSKGWKFSDPSGLPNGIKNGVLKGGAAGKSKIIVKGGGGGLPDLLNAGALTLPLRVQMVSTLAPCFESVFNTTAKNDVTQFKAKQ